MAGPQPCIWHRRYGWGPAKPEMLQGKASKTKKNKFKKEKIILFLFLFF
jgi:hypothetical protein